MLSIMAKPAGIVIGPVLAGYFLLKRYSLKRVALPLLGTAMGVLLYMAYNYLRFGSIFSAGQSTSRFTLEGFIPRLVGLLLSPGAGGGLFWYCPVTLLAGVGLWKLAKGDRLAEALAVLGMFSSYWILYSFWQFGGWSWGPRFLVPTLPLLLAPTALLDARGRRWLLALAAVGFLVNVPTLLTFYQRYYAEASDAGKLVQALALWGNGLDAPLFNIWGAALRQLDVALSVDVRSVLNSAGTPPAAGNLLSADLMQVMAVWWWFLPAVGMPLWLGIVAALGLIAGGVSCLWGWHSRVGACEVVTRNQL
ncbi:MAG: hypothetical protein HC886_06770 [Leptolyngbyaceae cyanobacterium SM1_1_3]|nr:hypothetical protein [Leptolyngbyaceae cyanobacterium SM1_1_3]